MKGKLIGIGVGPGDPELMTLKAVRAIEQADVIAVPVKCQGEKSVAFEIVKGACSIKDQTILPVIFSMSREKQERIQSRKEAVAAVKKELEQGHQVAMIALGDIGIYSTFMYVKKELEKEFSTEMIPGIPSFCAGASQALISIVEGRESFVVMPSYKNASQLGQALEQYHTVIVMKAGRKINEIYKILKEKGYLGSTSVIANCGMPSEYIGRILPVQEYGYFTTLIIKQPEKMEIR